MTAPIDRLKAVPVPGKDGAFMLVDKETEEVFDVAGKIKEDFDAGQCQGK